MFFHNINPELFSIGPLHIRYYGLFYVAAFIIAYLALPYLAKQRNLKLTKDDISDYLLYLLIGVVLGARLFHVLGNFSFYLSNPFQIIAIWNGGLAFHGGLTGAIIGGYLFAKKKNIHFYDLADITVIPLAIGLFLGRIGNFTNAELVGRITSVSWGVNFNNETVNGNPVFRHPSQLYESLKNLLIFFILFPLSKKTLPKGFLFWLFITLYGILRTSIEFFRQPWHDTLFFGFLSGGQLLTIPLIIIGGYMLYKVSK